ncbi:MAG: hypothetical protein FWE03_00815 [Firmicutes bacterium]|nr:hypothetical protein [Bacillota bacterium]
MAGNDINVPYLKETKTEIKKEINATKWQYFISIIPVIGFFIVFFAGFFRMDRLGGKSFMLLHCLVSIGTIGVLHSLVS